MFDATPYNCPQSGRFENGAYNYKIEKKQSMIGLIKQTYYNDRKKHLQILRS